jgi:hypothetical protein
MGLLVKWSDGGQFFREFDLYYGRKNDGPFLEQSSVGPTKVPDWDFGKGGSG